MDLMSLTNRDFDSVSVGSVSQAADRVDGRQGQYACEPKARLLVLLCPFSTGKFVLTQCAT